MQFTYLFFQNVGVDVKVLPVEYSNLHFFLDKLAILLMQSKPTLHASYHKELEIIWNVTVTPYIPIDVDLIKTFIDLCFAFINQDKQSTVIYCVCSLKICFY